MLSVLSIISVFIEILVIGLLTSVSFVFLLRFIRRKKFQMFFLFLALFLWAFYIALVLLSQLAYNIDWGIRDLLYLQQAASFCRLFSAIFLGLFWISFLVAWPWKIFFSSIVLLSGGFVAARLVTSHVFLVFRQEVIEPVIVYLPQTMDNLFWLLSWTVLAIYFFSRLVDSNSREQRNLNLLNLFSALLVLLAYVAGYLYLATSLPIFLLASWSILLLAVIGFVLGQVINPQSPSALYPWQFFRTRFLFKLILIFVLLIMVLFEATTLMTIVSSRRALTKSVQDIYQQRAQSLSEEIDFKVQALKGAGRVAMDQAGNYWAGKADLKFIQNLVEEKYSLDYGVPYVFDGQGRVFAHPDYVRAKFFQKIEPDSLRQEILQKKHGYVEFMDKSEGKMIGAFVPLKSIHGGVVIVQNARLAYRPIRQVETRSLFFIVAGIILTILVGIAFAKSVEVPIHRLIEGAQAVSAGDLDYKINVHGVDEIGGLAETFNRMTRDLKESQNRLILSEKMNSLGTLAAGMAHEIRNPLVSLRTFSQLLPQKWEDPGFREKFNAIVPKEIERINKIAEGLLKFGRKVKPELSKANVNAILEDVLVLFELECKKNNIRITTKFTQAPDITADVSQLSQVFVNIVLNAIQSMKNGGSLMVKTEVGEVVHVGKSGLGGMNQKKEDGSAEIVWGEKTKFEPGEKQTPIPVIFVEISDTGEGISYENLKNLFDPFFTTKVSGTGMGLPITLRIIEEHAGSIRVKSKVGQGTSFIITLPQNLEEEKRKEEEERKNHLADDVV